jgi:hypothetical protein
MSRIDYPYAYYGAPLNSYVPTEPSAPPLYENQLPAPTAAIHTARKTSETAKPRMLPADNSAASSSWSYLSKGFEYGMSFFFSKPSLSATAASWDRFYKDLENRKLKEKEEVDLLLSLLSNTPHGTHSDKALYKLDYCLQRYADKTKQEHAKFLRSVAEISKQFADGIPK